MLKSEQAVVAACADTMFPPGGPIPLSGTEAGLVEYVSEYEKALSPQRRFLVRAMFSFIQMSPCLFGPRRAVFTSLSPAERSAVFEEMAASPVYFRRVVFLSMRAIMTMGYFASPQVDSVIMRKQPDEVTP